MYEKIFKPYPILKEEYIIPYVSQYQVDFLILDCKHISDQSILKTIVDEFKLLFKRDDLLVYIKGESHG